MFTKCLSLLLVTSLPSLAVLPLPTSLSIDSTKQSSASPEKVDPKAIAMRELLTNISWTTNGTGALGSIAELNVPPNYQFTGNQGTVQLMKAFGNLTSNTELGYISPSDMSWFAVFEFDSCGYVKDDEKNQLHADKILEQLKEGQQEANKQLTKQGMPTLDIIGWQTPPFYNPQTNNLEWAIRIHSSDGNDVVNYKTKLLGRRGVMDVVLVCDESQLNEVVPAYQKLLNGFAFKKEESYAAFTNGDRVAEYGLTGLIVGGGLLVAAKSGLLAKLWKPIVVGIAAIGAALKRIFVGKTKETL